MKPGDLPHGLHAPRATTLRADQVIAYNNQVAGQVWTREDADGGPGHIFLRKGNTTYSYQQMATGDVVVCRGTSFAAGPFMERFCVETSQ